MEFNDATVKQYESMVHRIAWEYSSDIELHKDLVQEGFIGLRLACEQYDPKRAEFSTYAYRKIYSKVQQYVNYNMEMIHVPVLRKEAVGKLTCEGIEKMPTVAIEDNHDTRDIMSIIGDKMPKLLYDYYVMDMGAAELARRKYGVDSWKARKMISDEIAEQLDSVRTMIGV